MDIRWYGQSAFLLTGEKASSSTRSAINFLEPPDDFLTALGAPVTRLDTSGGNADALLGTSSELTVALLAPPLPRA